MSEEEEIALIREGYLAWNEGGVSAAAAAWKFHPEIEWINPPEMPGGGTYIGKDAVLAFLREWEGSAGVLNLSFEIEQIIPIDGEYLVISVATGTSESGVVLPPHNWFHLMRAEDGLLRRAQLFLDREQALEAAGLSE
jgi:ketosteroid isomerase-like protein